jgi:peptide/nickel transport system substrate-binding protein
MGVDPKDVASIKKSCPDLKWARYSPLNGFMLALRMDTKPFDDIRVRRALNMAINRQEILDALANGDGEPVIYPLSLCPPLQELPDSAKELFTYNPQKAKKLLAEAGYADGFSFKAQIPNNAQAGLDLGAMVVGYLSKIGVTLELEPMDYGSYLSMMYKKKHGPGYFFSASQDNPFQTIRMNFVTGQTWNAYIFSDKYVDETYFKTVEDPNLSPEESAAVMKKLAVHCVDQAPAIWLPGPYAYTTWWPWVKNYYGELRVGAWRPGPIFARIWIDQDLKKKMGY